MLEHAHNDSKRHRHGPVSGASKPTIEAKGEIRGLIWVTWLNLPTLVRLQGLGAQAGVESPGYPYLFLSCAFCFYLVYLSEKDAQQATRCIRRGEFGDTGGLVEHTVAPNFALI
jgi:hypothetical protein